MNFYFVECHVLDHAAAKNNTGNQHPVPIATVVTNTGIWWPTVLIMKNSQSFLTN